MASRINTNTNTNTNTRTRISSSKTNMNSKFLVIAFVLFEVLAVTHCNVLDRPVLASSAAPDTVAEASGPTETTVSVVLSPPPLVSSTNAATAASSLFPVDNQNVTVITNQTDSETKSAVASSNTNTTAEHRHDSKVMDIIQMGLTSLRHAGDRLKKFVSKIEAGIKSGALNETIENVKVKIEKGEIDLKKIIHAYKQKSNVGLEQLIKRISDDSHTLLDKLHGRVDGHLVGNSTVEVARNGSVEISDAKDVQEASETVTILTPVPTEADA